MNTLAIIFVVMAVISVGFIYYALKTAERYDEELDSIPTPKFQPRQVTDLSTPVEKPKRRYKRRNKKKKPAVAENAQVEKRPVGRPKKSN
jgi:hypothetical protein